MADDSYIIKMLARYDLAINELLRRVKRSSDVAGRAYGNQNGSLLLSWGAGGGPGVRNFTSSGSGIPGMTTVWGKATVQADEYTVATSNNVSETSAETFTCYNRGTSAFGANKRGTAFQVPQLDGYGNQTGTLVWIAIWEDCG